VRAAERRRRAEAAAAEQAERAEGEAATEAAATRAAVEEEEKREAAAEREARLVERAKREVRRLEESDAEEQMNYRRDGRGGEVDGEEEGSEGKWRPFCTMRLFPCSCSSFRCLALPGCGRRGESHSHQAILRLTYTHFLSRWAATQGCGGGSGAVT